MPKKIIMYDHINNSKSRIRSKLIREMLERKNIQKIIHVENTTKDIYDQEIYFFSIKPCSITEPTV